MAHRKRVEEKPSIEPVLDSLEINYRPDRLGWQAIRCPSPNHDDFTESCSLNLTEGVWRCHGCDVGGDVYSLYMEVKGVDFPTSRRCVEAAAGEGGAPVASRSRHRRGEPRGEVPAESGYRPRYRREAPARLRHRGYDPRDGALR